MKLNTLRLKNLSTFLLIACLAILASACNLSASPEEEAELTQEATNTVPPSRTPSGTLSVPTTLPLTSLAPTTRPGTFPTSAVSVPTAVIPPPATQPPPLNVPISIVILSPIPGNIVAGNVQVLGSASHPQFLQYQVEYGPDPNPGNLWFPVTGPIRNTVLNGLLGVWNTGAVQDGTYQLRLRVWLRDATNLTTVVNNVRIQNRIPTPQPSATPSVPRPIAAFVANRYAGQAPLSVQFTNQSTGNITNYLWNFGDNTSSNEPSPRHDYNRPGIYTVTLTVSGPGGASNVSTQIYVQSPTPPNAGFSMDRTSGPAPLSVQFTDQSTGNITNWNWNFSDGSTSDEQNPRHTFQIPGTYNVFLTVSGPGGSSSTRREITVLGPTNTPIPTITATLEPPPTNTPTATSTDSPLPPPTETPTATSTDAPPVVEPEAGFATAVDNLAVQFTDVSVAGTDAITAWQWDFGDGNTSAEQNPQHVYATGGDYSVSLTVTDAAGRTDSASQQVSVAAPTATPTGPTASFTAAVDALAVQFTDTSTAGTNPITGWQWDFGDGNTSTDQNPQHVYTEGGSYDVSLTVTDAAGLTAVFSQPVSVSPPEPSPLPAAPLASFTTTIDDLTVTFTDTSTTPSGAPITGWLWNFGDGGTSTDQNPQHTYLDAGNYTVTLTVTDANNQTGESSQPISVNAPQPPVASFSTAVDNLTVSFADMSVSPGGTAITGWEWNFGDGNTSTEQNPQHTYAQTGNYDVSLIVTDAEGRTGQTSQQVAVTAQPPEAAFTFVANELTVNFTDMSTSPSGQPIVTWAWDFGDGNFSDQQNPEHTYASAGDYTVTLTVTDAAGGVDGTEQLVSVAEAAAQEGDENLALELPSLPDLTETDLQNRLNNIYQTGQSLGNRADVFSIAGDETAQNPNYLDPFANNANYVLDGGTSYLQGVIDAYNATDLGGATSFNRNSLATGQGWTVEDLLDPANRDASNCNEGESPLACELRVNQPAVVIISIGYNDVSAGTNPDDFRSRLQQVVDTAVNAGVIPVLTTIQPRPDNANATTALNNVIIEVANDSDVPVYNLWFALNLLPNSGVEGGNLTQAPGVPGDLTSSATSAYGQNTRNRDILTILSDIRNLIFQ